jgi:hypothetical protein
MIMMKRKMTATASTKHLCSSLWRYQSAFNLLLKLTSATAHSIEATSSLWHLQDPLEFSTPATDYLKGLLTTQQIQSSYLQNYVVVK